MAKKSKHQKRIEKLEREKLELEVAQLKNTKNKKNTLLIVTQAIIPIVALLVAFFSTYLSVYKDSSENKLEGMSARNEAILQENQTILELIDLERRKDTLGRQIQGFEYEKQRIFTQTNRLLAESDSAQSVINRQNREKAILAGNIVGLRKTKIKLEDDLGFAVINQNLQDFKNYPAPKYLYFWNIEVALKSNSVYSSRIIDSLNLYAQFEELYAPALFLLYQGTGNVIYRDAIYVDLENNLEKLKKGGYFSQIYVEILSHSSWPLDDKMSIFNTLRSKYKQIESNSGRSSILSVISILNYDQNFDLAEIDFDYYWDFLTENRTLLFVEDSVINKFNPMYNIFLTSPQLYLSLLTFLSSESQNNYLYGESAAMALDVLLKFNSNEIQLPQSVDSIYETLFSKSFGDIDPEEDPSFMIRFYPENKEIIDSWIFGNFERFRSNKEAYLKMIEEGTL